ncbi:MAG: hypothetical protein U0324_30540 [Polyangiales bacterium]
MDDPLKLKIAASLDLPADTAADPEVARAIDADPEARAYARSLHTLDAALRRWPSRAREDAAWESLAARIDARVAELPSAAKVKKKKGVSPQEPDFAAAPVFQDDPHPSTESNQPMSEPQDQDADLESLAALTRTSNVPPSVSIPSVRPALTDDVDDTSSGIVDIKKLAAMARSAESSAPPPPKPEEPKAEAKPEKPASKQDDVMVAPSRAAAAVPKVDVPPPAKGGNTWLGMVGGLALAAGAFAIYNSTGRQAANEASAPPAASAPEMPAPAAAAAPTPPPPPTAAPVAQGPAAPEPAAQPAAPTEAPAAAAEARMGSTSQSAAPTSAPPPAEAAPDNERAADSVVARRESVAAPTAARAAAARAPAPAAPAGGAAAPARPQSAAAAPAQAAPPPAAPTPPAARPAPAPTAPAAPAAAPGSVDEMMRRVTGAGAAAPAAAAAAPTAELPERPTRSQITGVLSGLNGPVRSCANGQTGTAPVAIVINSDGTVRSANVSGQFAGTPAGECIAGVVQRAHFQPFRAQQVNITYPFVILPPR